jgi:hypothetical protein
MCIHSMPSRPGYKEKGQRGRALKMNASSGCVLTVSDIPVASASQPFNFPSCSVSLSYTTHTHCALAVLRSPRGNDGERAGGFGLQVIWPGESWLLRVIGAKESQAS